MTSNGADSDVLVGDTHFITPRRLALDDVQTATVRTVNLSNLRAIDVERIYAEIQRNEGQSNYLDLVREMGIFQTEFVVADAEVETVGTTGTGSECSECSDNIVGDEENQAVQVSSGSTQQTNSIPIASPVDIMNGITVGDSKVKLLIYTAATITMLVVIFLIYVLVWQ